MVTAKFQDKRTPGSGRCLKAFTIHGHGGHLGSVTCTIYTNIRHLFPKQDHHEIKRCRRTRSLNWLTHDDG